MPPTPDRAAGLRLLTTPDRVISAAAVTRRLLAACELHSARLEAAGCTEGVAALHELRGVALRVLVALGAD